MTMKKEQKIRVRFPPSPTGFLHIGSLRTVLLNYLFAKKEKGTFLLRIEDTDRERYVEGAVESLIRTLNGLDIQYDEGPYLDKNGKIVQKGKYGPYIQSERLDIYKKYAEQLIKEKKAYYCFCKEDRLEKMREQQAATKQPPMYDRECLGLKPEEAETKLKKNEEHVIRLLVPRDETIIFNDLLHGKVEFKGNIVDDQVLLKSDGFPTYHLAHVVDDHLMKITHVIRGEEWLSSAPKHILLYKYFGWEPPVYAHHSLLLNKEGGKLSKRRGDVAVEDFLKKGYLPQALLNFVGLLIMSVPDKANEILNVKELIKMFDWEKVHKTPAVFNTEKLDWVNSQYIKNLKAKKLVDLCKLYFEQAKIKIDNQQLEKIVEIAKDRMKKLSDIIELSGFLLAKTLKYEPKLLIWKKSDKSATKKNLEGLLAILEGIDEKEFRIKNLEAKIMDFISSNKLTNGEVLWPMRVALTGLDKSPGPFEVAEALGKEKSSERVRKAIERL